MTAHAKALAWVTGNIGQHEVPMGSNRGPFVQSCQAATWLKGTGWPWCVACWIKAWTVAGYKLPYLGAGAYQMFDWYKANLPAWVVPIERAKPGAACIWNEGAGHCSMLKSYDAKTRLVTTVDGNVSDSVAIRTRPVSMLRGVIDPPEHAPPPPVKAKPPVFEVVTSAAGHKVIYVSGVKAISNKLPQILKRYGKGIIIRRRPAK